MDDLILSLHLGIIDIQSNNGTFQRNCTIFGQDIQKEFRKSSSFLNMVTIFSLVHMMDESNSGMCLGIGNVFVHTVDTMKLFEALI